MSAGDRTVADVLADAQRLGTLGSQPVDEVIAHSRLFLPALVGLSGRVIDIGTGAGVPGLVLAEARHDLEFVLVDRREARADALRRAVAALGWTNRVRVVCADTADLGRDPEYSGTCVAVVSRGFGPPVTTLTEGRRFLTMGGVLVVSEPPVTDPDRWPLATLESLGFSQPQYLQGIAMFHVEHS